MGCHDDFKVFVTTKNGNKEVEMRSMTVNSAFSEIDRLFQSGFLDRLGSPFYGVPVRASHPRATDFDLDVFDSYYVKSTGTPVNYGLNLWEVHSILKFICKNNSV